MVLPENHFTMSLCLCLPWGYLPAFLQLPASSVLFMLVITTFKLRTRVYVESTWCLGLLFGCLTASFPLTSYSNVQVSAFSLNISKNIFVLISDLPTAVHARFLVFEHGLHSRNFLNVMTVLDLQRYSESLSQPDFQDGLSSIQDLHATVWCMCLIQSM